MNVIAFATKRTFHGFLRVTRRAFASVGLTAARFDMMQAIQGPGRDPPMSSRQDELRRELGVTAGVVSRMVRALEKLGFVGRARSGRTFVIWLTAEGRSRLLSARSMLLRSLQRLVYLAICFGKHHDPNERFRRMDRLESYLRVLRQHLGDRAELYYAWGHPDD